MGAIVKKIPYCTDAEHGLAMLEGVCVQDLEVLPTQGGCVLHMLRADNPLFTHFGEVYFSEVDVNAIKAWKMHTIQHQRLTVPVGIVKVVLYDARKTSISYGKVQEVFLGREQHYKLLLIPPHIWYGFANVGGENALICNCTDTPHMPQESYQKAMNSPEIPYAWV